MLHICVKFPDCLVNVIWQSIWMQLPHMTSPVYQMIIKMPFSWSTTHKTYGRAARYVVISKRQNRNFSRHFEDINIFRGKCGGRSKISSNSDLASTEAKEKARLPCKFCKNSSWPILLTAFFAIFVLQTSVLDPTVSLVDFVSESNKQ